MAAIAHNGKRKAWARVCGGNDEQFNPLYRAVPGQRRLAMAVVELRHQGFERTLPTLRQIDG